MRPIILFAWLANTLFGQIAFEVASIKPAPPQEMGRVSIHRSTDKGRLNYSNVSFIDLITDAYRVQPRQVSGPEWLDSVRFDIAAKLPAGAEEDQIPEMLQALLKERFALKLREDSKAMPIYALVAGKTGPKMKKADAVGNINSSGKNGLMHLSGKTTLAKFADRLSARLDRPVVDQTGLEGSYEIELEWTADTVDNPAADAPPSIYTAVQDQLGLRLSATKGPVRQLIVEHVDKTPSEN